MNNIRVKLHNKNRKVIHFYYLLYNCTIIVHIILQYFLQCGANGLYILR